jgi:hypothetical protein
VFFYIFLFFVFFKRENNSNIEHIRRGGGAKNMGNGVMGYGFPSNSSL